MTQVILNLYVCQRGIAARNETMGCDDDHVTALAGPKFRFTGTVKQETKFSLLFRCDASTLLPFGFPQQTPKTAAATAAEIISNLRTNAVDLTGLQDGGRKAVS